MTATVPSTPRTASRVTFPRLLASEWIKLRTLRSSFWCSLLIVVLTIGLAVLVGSVFRSGGAAPTGDAARNIEVVAETLGTRFTQLIACILGVLLIGGEFGSGMIRTTFLAAPRRWAAVTAKLVVLFVAVFVVSLVSTALAAVASAPLLAGRGIPNRLGEPGVFLPILGAALYLGLVSVLACLVGVIVRNSAAGIAIILALLLVVPPILLAIGSIAGTDWPTSVVNLLPPSAGAQLYTYGTGSATPLSDGVVQLTPGWAVVDLIGWLVVAGIPAFLLLRNRDA